MQSNTQIHPGASPELSQAGLWPSDPLVAASRILRRLLAGFPGALEFRIGDSAPQRIGKGSPAFTIVIRDPRVLRQLVLEGNPLPLAEAYFHGRVDIEGDLYAALRLKNYFLEFRPSFVDRMRLVVDALRLSVRAGAARRGAAAGDFAYQHSRNSDREAIAYHYDVSNDFYRLWLDPQMVYSCAYFEDPAATLEQAQCAKLDLICRKLRLAAGESFLDVGCGWGALVCWAARHYGVRAHGITLSQQQLAYARERIRREGLEGQVTVELRDYRDLPGEAVYDKAASVGMFEHVGLANLPLYNATVHRVLKPGGLFLNHGITHDEEGWNPRATDTAFINRYVFPDGELDCIGNIVRVMERAHFEIHDVEGLRPHYAMTLRHWVRRLEDAREQALALVGEERYRIWRMYMSACALEFEGGATGIHQILASRRGATPRALPLTRRDVYSAK